MIEDSAIVKQENVKDNLIYTFIFVIIMCITLFLYFQQGNFEIVDNHFLIATIFLLINIPIHEAGHIIFLKLFYPSARFKVGFKMVFIYPAFYVDTSYSYLLPRFKRMAVYLAGNIMNAIFVLVILLFIPKFLPFCYLIISNILVNFLPIVKSDGYYSLLTLLDKYNISKNKKSEYIEDFIRGFIMFIFLYIISYVL